MSYRKKYGDALRTTCALRYHLYYVHHFILRFSPFQSAPHKISPQGRQLFWQLENAIQSPLMNISSDADRH